MSDLFGGEFLVMNEVDQVDEKKQRKDAVFNAYCWFKRQNPTVGLMAVRQVQNLTQIMARLPEPFKSEHPDTIWNVIWRLSKNAMISDAAIIEPNCESRKQSWSINAARKWLDERDVKIPDGYQRFLDSDEWYRFARGLKEEKDWQCQMCLQWPGHGNLRAHHVKKDYELKMCKENIWIVCIKCHGIIHFVRDHA